MTRGAVRVLALALAALAPAALAAPPPAASEPPGALDAPWPSPDPNSWWSDERPKPAEAADPLAGRRVGRNAAPPIRLGADPLLYRLWGLPPLQGETLKSGEMILELWVRPSLTVRQAVVRLVVRRDGEAFVQARAGLGCCTPEIGRRVGFDAKLDTGWAPRLLKLKDDPLWDAPRDVRVVEAESSTDSICVNGVAYDLVLATTDKFRSIRRACDPAEVGQAGDVLEAMLSAALGHEPRFDVAFPKGADFSGDRRAYQALVAGGGALKPAANARPQPTPPELETPELATPPG